MNETGQREEFESVFNYYRISIPLAAQTVAEDFGLFFEDFRREDLGARACPVLRGGRRQT